MTKAALKIGKENRSLPKALTAFKDSTKLPAVVFPAAVPLSSAVAPARARLCSRWNS